MAVTWTALETTGSNVDQTSFSSGSISPSSNKLILAWVYSICATIPNTPTASGNGLTWEEIDSQIDSSGLRRITLFRSLGSSPSTGSLTFDFGGQTQTGCAWSIIEYENVDTSGTNGSGAIVQHEGNASLGNATSLTLTLSSFSSTANATAGGFGLPLNTANIPQAGTGFTRTGQRHQNTPNLSIGSEFRSDNDTTVDMSSGAASIPWVGIAVEIKHTPVTEVGITKDLQYAIKQPESITKQLQYELDVTLVDDVVLSWGVLTEVLLTKSLHYVVKQPEAVTKSLQYTVRQSESVTKSLQYMIEREVSAITKSLTYTVEREQTAITKDLQYEINTDVSLVDDVVLS